MAMSRERILMNCVAGVRTRVRILVTQQWVCTGLALAMLASLALVAATRLGWWTDGVDWIWAVVIAGGLLGFAVGWTRPVTPLVAAQIADERGGLKERLSTAVELSRQAARSAVAEAQIADAARHAGALRPAQVLPWKPPPQSRWLATSAVLLAAGLWLPDLSVFHSAQDLKDREAIRQEGEKLQQVAKQMEKRLPRGGDENAAIMRRINQEMKRLGKDMRNNRIPKKQAMLRANDLQKELKEAEQRSGNGPARKSLDEVSKDLENAARRQESQGNREAAQALRRMAASVEQNDMDAARKQLERMARELQSGQLSRDDLAKAQKTLEEMAKSLEGSRLNQASGDMKDAAKKLQQAAAEARKLQEQLKNAGSDAERKELQQQAARRMQEQTQQAAQQCKNGGEACANPKAGSKSAQNADQLRQASQALQSAQQSLQQAGQDQGQQGQSANASQGEMGQEFGESPQTGQGNQQGGGKGEQGKAGQSATATGQSGGGTGAGLGGPGRGAGGNVGPQQPLQGPKKDVLVPGTPNPRGKHLTRSYMGTPDPSEDRAAYYSIMPDKVKAAEASLGREDIPIAVKKPVQRYFESIRPK